MIKNAPINSIFSIKTVNNEPYTAGLQSVFEYYGNHRMAKCNIQISEAAKMCDKTASL